MTASDPQNISIYIHWPFCTRICPYCDFNVYKTQNRPELLTAITEDLRHWREWSGPRNLTSIHFGGGTPSLMSPQNIHRLISHITSLWTHDETESHAEPEIAIEANPSDYDKQKWQDYAGAGVTRLSLGVQSFEDAFLKYLGRNHDSHMARNSLEGARDIFSSLSLDLIFGMSGQSSKQIEHDLGSALSYKPDHISTYQLTIEEGTAFDKARQRGEDKAVNPDTSAAFLEHITKRLTSQGFEHYEVSNFAKPDHQSRHNLNYWYGGDYVGVGPGAQGRLTLGGQRFATTAQMKPAVYIAGLNASPLAFRETQKLSQTDWAEEYLLMGLRINEGVSLERYRELAGSDLPETILQDFITQDMLAIQEGRLIATPAGRLVLNYLTQKLLGA